jgi:hypothetical protein
VAGRNRFSHPEDKTSSTAEPDINSVSILTTMYLKPQKNINEINNGTKLRLFPVL